MTAKGFNSTELDEEKIFPSIISRIQALFVDFWIIIGLVILFRTLLFPHMTGALVGLKITLFFTVALLYDPLLTKSGGTIGQRTMGIKIRCFEDPHRKITLAQAYFRSIMKILLGWISFLNVSIDPFKRAMHDKASGSVVLNNRI
ncbi:MAG: RDD family protein [Bacteroidetes bacterium]|nr:RDD family protein [Bacteroidota bacterium]